MVFVVFGWKGLTGGLEVLCGSKSALQSHFLGGGLSSFEVWELLDFGEV